MYPDDWAIVTSVQQRYSMNLSQALRFIINDYRLRHNIPVPDRNDTQDAPAPPSQP